VTFASAKPIKGGVLLGLAVPASADARLTASRGKEGWSDRLAATILLTPRRSTTGSKTCSRRRSTRRRRKIRSSRRKPGPRF